MLAARDRQRSGPARGSGSRNSSSGREVSREDPGATLQVCHLSLPGIAKAVHKLPKAPEQAQLAGSASML